MSLSSMCLKDACERCFKSGCSCSCHRLVARYSAPPRLLTFAEKNGPNAFTATVKADGSEWTSAASTEDEACARALTVQLQLREKEKHRG